MSRNQITHDQSTYNSLDFLCRIARLPFVTISIAATRLLRNRNRETTTLSSLPCPDAFDLAPSIKVCRYPHNM